MPKELAVKKVNMCNMENNIDIIAYCVYYNIKSIFVGFKSRSIK